LPHLLLLLLPLLLLLLLLPLPLVLLLLLLHLLRRFTIPSCSSSFLCSTAQADLLVQSLCAVIFSYDPVGLGIPYASAVGPDKKESVVDLAVQVRCCASASARACNMKSDSISRHDNTNVMVILMRVVVLVISRVTVLILVIVIPSH